MSPSHLDTEPSFFIIGGLPELDFHLRLIGLVVGSFNLNGFSGRADLYKLGGLEWKTEQGWQAMQPAQYSDRQGWTFLTGYRNLVNEFLVSKETVVLRRWERSKQKFGFIKRVDKG